MEFCPRNKISPCQNNNMGYPGKFLPNMYVCLRDKSLHQYPYKVSKYNLSRPLIKKAEYEKRADCIAVYEESIYIAQGSKIIHLSTDLKEISSFQIQGLVLQLIVSSLGIAVRSQESIQLFDFQYNLVWKLKDTFKSMAEFEGKLFTLQSAQEVWSWDKQIYTRCFRTQGADTLIALKGKIIVGAKKLQVWRNEESGYQLPSI